MNNSKEITRKGKRVTTISLSSTTISKLDQKRHELNLSRSWIVEYLIENYLDRLILKEGFDYDY